MKIICALLHIIIKSFHLLTERPAIILEIFFFSVCEWSSVAFMFFCPFNFWLFFSLLHQGCQKCYALVSFIKSYIKQIYDTQKSISLCLTSAGYMWKESTKIPSNKTLWIPSLALFGFLMETFEVYLKLIPKKVQQHTRPNSPQRNMTISYVADFKWDVVIHTAEAQNQ